jgi:D-alanyl-lipoteichoic acid acyltransferase DltB (MBOAT superfamily)
MPLNIKFRDWGNWGMILSIVITFVLIGMWHGSNWTFALFGLYHGLLYIPLILSGAFFKKAKLKTNKLGLPVAKDFGRMVITFSLVTIGLIIFRAPSLTEMCAYLRGIINHSILIVPWLPSVIEIGRIALAIVITITVEWLQRNKQHGLELGNVHIATRYVLYWVLIVLTIALGNFGANQFIYFQF